MPPLCRRIFLTFAGLIALAPLFAGAAEDKKPAAKIGEYKGKVVPLADLVTKLDTRLDEDAAPHWLALVGEDGKIYPLIKDSGSRMFFKDADLLKRPMRLTGRFLPGSQLLQVTAVHSYKKGQLHEVYYWCDICSIRRSEKNVCECCGGPMVLHEDPLPR
jgi:hypothetical protein